MFENGRKYLTGIFLSDGEVSDEIRICDMGWEKCRPSHSYGPAVRNFYLIHFVCDGKGTFISPRGEYTLGKNNAFLIRPDEATKYFADEEEPWSYMWVGFSGIRADELVAKCFDRTEVFEVPVTLISELEEIYSTASVSRKTLLDVISFVYKLLGFAYSSLGSAGAPTRPDIIESAVRFMENNYFHAFDITWLAGELGMSRAHFSTVFSAAMKTSPYTYLTKFRIGKAEKLLIEQPELSVTEVAYSVGFSSIERFSEMFKKYTGLSPLGYRKKFCPN